MVPRALFQKWMHSFEEDSGDVRVYRPAGYAFPPARGRAGLEFHADGTFTQWGIGRGDAPTPTAGRWQVGGPNEITVTPSGGAPPFTLVIVEVSTDVLKVKPK